MNTYSHTDGGWAVVQGVSQTNRNNVGSNVLPKNILIFAK